MDIIAKKEVVFMRRMKFGEILVEEQLISEAELQEALKRQKTVRKKLGQILIDMRLLTENEMLVALSRKLKFQFEENPIKHLDKSVRDLVTYEFSQQHKILPLFIENGTLFFATNDPLDFVTMEDLSMITGFDTLPILSPMSAIEHGLNVLYNLDNVTVSLSAEIDQDEESLIKRVDSAPVVKMVNNIINSAYSVNASDIHIEPGKDATRIRFRIDGTLSEHMVLNKDLHELVATRIKIVSGMNIAEKRKPQDGSFRHVAEYTEVDIRVSSIPTPDGEKLVLRLLGADQNIKYDLDSIDISDESKQQLREISRVPHGILLLTGPTGSGKTTTLYSLLNEISTPEISIVTVEDPVEKSFEGITQVQINAKAGLTFASGLRSILRQDPDVIMLGEIRDSETASIAIRAAITGHFVLSTLHTNDALSSIVRLIDMGVEPYMVASSIKAVIAQRLVKKVCSHCGQKVPLANEDKILFNMDGLTHEMKGGGCERCNHTGYSGRQAVFEIVFIDDTLQDMISDGATMSELKSYVVSKGTKFLKDDVIRLIQEGKTTTEEARKILFSVN